MASASSTTNQNEQEQATQHHNEVSSGSSEQILDSSAVPASTPILPGEILTENDHEDNLMERIDELIRNFLSRSNRRSPYRSSFRWTFDDEPNLSYSVIVKIISPSPMI